MIKVSNKNKKVIYKTAGSRSKKKFRPKINLPNAHKNDF